MLKLLGIKLENFKSIHKADVNDLDDINVFFGPTNSGKTSFLESVFFQCNHQAFVEDRQYLEFLHSKADPASSALTVETDWVVKESIPLVNLRPHDHFRVITRVDFTDRQPKASDEVYVNDQREENADRAIAIIGHLRKSVKLSSSRRPGDSKKIYFSGPEESPDLRRRRFMVALEELELQGEQYHLFLSHIQKLFPYLVYDMSSKQNILEFFGLGFLGTAKLFVYLFDARYSIVLIDEPEIHLYPSLMHRFVRVLHEVVEQLGKQIMISTHSTLFLHERHLGNFYHMAKSKHFKTTVRRIEQGDLLQGLDLLNAPPEAVLQSDMIVYVEGPWDVGVMEEFIVKFPELDHANIVILQLGGGSMGNGNIDPVKLKMHNPLSFVLIDSERTSENGDPDPSHETFRQRCFAAHVYCLMLQRQAMENYFSVRALREVFHDRVPAKLRELAPYKPLVKQGMPWFDKAENRKIARDMTREEILAWPELAQFFQELITVSKQLE